MQTEHSGSLPRAHPVHHADPAHSNVQLHLVHPSPLPLSCLELYGRRRGVRFCSATLERSPPPRRYIIIPPFTITCDAPYSRTGQVRASEPPPAPRRPGRNRPVSPIGHNAPRSQGPRGGRNCSVAGRRSLPHPHGRGRRTWRRCLRLLRWRGQFFGRNDWLQSQQQVPSSPIRSLPDAAGDVSCLRSWGAGQSRN